MQSTVLTSILIGIGCALCTKQKNITDIDIPDPQVRERFERERQRLQTIIDTHTNGCQLVFNEKLEHFAFKTFRQSRIGVPIADMFETADDFVSVLASPDTRAQMIARDYMKTRSDFSVYHEIAHIQLNHSMKNTVHFALGSIIASLFKNPKIATTIFCAHVASTIPLSRYFEKQADLRACELMGSNKQGIQTFVLLQDFLQKHETPSLFGDLMHPSIETRIKYMSNWKLKL